MATIKLYRVFKWLMHDEAAFEDWLYSHSVDGFYYIVGDDPLTDSVLIEVLN